MSCRERGARSTRLGVLMGEQSIAVVRYTQCKQSISQRVPASRCLSPTHDDKYADVDEDDDVDNDNDDDDQKNKSSDDLRPRVVVFIAAHVC
jgi:hypothetical protein